MTSIYYLYHYKIAAEDDILDIDSEETGEKLVGIFSSQETADAAIRQLSDKPGFRDWIGGFRVLKGDLDTYAWEDGFISSDEA